MLKPVGQDTIREGYWSAYDCKDPENQMRSAHIRHCIDYLRQSVMCHADTNLEPIVREGGVSGFGTEKQCRNFTRLAEWANIWAWEELTMPSHHEMSF